MIELEAQTIRPFSRDTIRITLNASLVDENDSASLI